MEKKPIVISKNTTNKETVKYIKELAMMGTHNNYLQKIANNCLNSIDPVKSVFDFAYDTAVYFTDPENTQRLQPVHVTIRDKKANCVDYTILQSALLSLMKIPHIYRMVSFDRSKELEHIYIVADGKILDPVINQKQDGTENFESRKPSAFNKEINYTYKKEIQMPILEIMQGTKEIQANQFKKRFGRSQASRIGILDLIPKNKLGAIDWTKIITKGLEVGGDVYNSQNTGGSVNTGYTNPYIIQTVQPTTKSDYMPYYIAGGVAVLGLGIYFMSKK